MEILNYIFAIIQYFNEDAWQLVLIISFILSFKYWNILKTEKILLGITTFILYGLILTSFVQDIPRAVEEEIYVLVVGWLLPFILGYSISDKMKKKSIIITALIIFTVFVFLGILSCYGVIPEKIIGIRLSLNGYLKICSVWHIQFAGRCILMLMISVTVLLFDKISDKKRIIFLVLSVILYIGLLLSCSRLYFLVSGILLIVIFSFYIYKTKYLKFFVLSAITILILATAVYKTTPLIQQRVLKTSLTEDISIVTRINMYKYAISLFRQYPIFGVGPCQATIRNDFFKLKTDGIQHTHLHSIYLNILAGFGIIGLLIFFYIIFNILRRLFVIYNKEKSIPALAMIFAWTAILIADSFDCVLKDAFASALYFWITGLVLGGSLVNDKTKKEKIKC